MICNKVDCDHYDKSFKSHCYIKSMKGVEECLKPKIQPRQLWECKHNHPHTVVHGTKTYWIVCNKCGFKHYQEKDHEIAQKKCKEINAERYKTKRLK